ncbi:MAG TPA: extracellular solute-binding protein [Ruminiclostridium sp.]|nr:extracellular solute-binding protein [Ruminiclostridium sp.]
MKKVKMISGILALTLILGTTAGGCANSSSKQKQRELVVANWKGYGSDTSYAIKTFEKENNCKIVHQYFDSEDALLNMLKQGGVGKIDVMLPNLAYMQRVIKGNLAEPLDTSKLENYKDIIDSLKNQKDLRDGSGKLYGIPWTWGTTAIGYNPDKIKEKPTSISVLWDDKYNGQVAFNDDYTCAILTAAIYLKEKDPYNPDLSKVKDALIKAKQNSKLLWSSYDDFSKAYTSNSIIIGNMWSGSATELKAEGQNIDYVYPEEGVIAWQDNWCIAKNAPEKDLAYKWLNYMTSKEFLTEYSNDLKAQPPVPANQKVINAMSDSQKKSLWMYPSLPKNMIMEKSLSDETNEKWKQLWDEVKAS